MLIIRIRQEACQYWFGFKWEPISSVWMFATNRQLDYWWCKTNSHWCSVTLIVRIGQEASWYNFCIRRQQVPYLCMFATNRCLGYPWWEANTYWHTIDTPDENGVGRVSRSPLPIPAANKLVMHNTDQITFQLPYLQDQQLLTLHLHSS